MQAINDKLQSRLIQMEMLCSKENDKNMQGQERNKCV